MKRVSDWHSKLSFEMDRQNQIVAGGGFVWGQHDCLVGFARGIVRTLLDVDMFTQWIGTYDSPASAFKMLRKEGYDSLATAMADYLPPLKHASKARIGDLLLVPDLSGSGIDYTIGMCNGGHVVCLGLNGLITMSMTMQEIGFEI